MGTSFVEDHLKIISLLLYNDDVDVRLAAGEAVAIIYEMCDLSSLPKSHAHNEDLHEENGNGSAHEGLQEIVTRMQDLAKNRGDETRRSKKDRATLRRTFRELLAVIEVMGFLPIFRRAHGRIDQRVEFIMWSMLCRAENRRRRR
jgi:hypothetical protein